jgi:hypothetical protein
MKLLALAAAGAAVLSAAPAFAVDFNTYDLSFTNGTAVVSQSRTAPGEYQDTYVFTLDQAGTFSGSLITQLQTNPAGDIVSNLDFGNSIDGVSIDGGTPFDLPSAGDVESVNLASILLAAGTHSLVVNYTVETASLGNGASYAGPINFTPSAATTDVPEPATWAMFVGAFGLVGASLRQRRTARLSYEI